MEYIGIQLIVMVYMVGGMRMARVYDVTNVMDNYLKNSSLAVDMKDLVDFPKEVVGFTPEEYPCIVVELNGCPIVISDKSKDKQLFTGAEFVKEIDLLILNRY